MVTLTIRRILLSSIVVSFILASSILAQNPTYVFLTASQLPNQQDPVYIGQASSSTLSPLITGLYTPNDIICEEERIIVAESFSERSMTSIEAYSRNGIKQSTIYENDSSSTQVSTLLRTGNDLIFGTRSPRRGQNTSGIWIIRNALNSVDVKLTPEQLIGGEEFTANQTNVGSSVNPQLVVSRGKYAEEILVIDRSFEFGSSTAKLLPDRIFRLTKESGYRKKIIFTEAQNVKDTNLPRTYSSLIEFQDGYLASDIQNDELLKIDSEGRIESVFAKIYYPLRLALSSSGNILVTTAFGEPESPIIILDSNGKQVGKIGGYRNLVPITVCK